MLYFLWYGCGCGCVRGRRGQLERRQERLGIMFIPCHHNYFLSNASINIIRTIKLYIKYHRLSLLFTKIKDLLGQLVVRL